MGTLQVGGTTLGVKNSSTNKIDLSNVGAVTLTDSAVIPASVGSSMVLLKSVDTTTTSTTIVEFIHGSNGVVLDSTYDVYKVIISNCVPVTNAKAFRADVGTSSGYSLSGNIGGIGLFYNKYDNSDNGPTTVSFPQSRNIETNTLDNTVSRGGCWGELSIHQIADSSVPTTISMNLNYSASNGYLYGGSGFSSTMTNQAQDRIRFYFQDSSVFAKGRITIYGVKNA